MKDIVEDDAIGEGDALTIIGATGPGNTRPPHLI